MHQDMDGKASALTLSDYRRDYAIVKELGANFLRLAHYPHNDFAFCLCDSLGLIVQTEIPWVNVCGVDARQIYFNNIHEQMREMISNLYNHPSIGFWGMWNELDSWGNQPGSLQGELDAARVVSETAKLYAYAKQLDPGRFVGLTDDSEFQRDGYTALKADYYSQNRYHGWYYDVDNFEKFTEAMERIHKQMGVTNVGEYGVGINPFCHYWDRSRVKRDLEDDTIHSEEYGNLFHESYVRQIQRMPWLNFTAVWILFDFPVANRQEGWMDSDNGEVFVPNEARKYMNDKGLVTRDRLTRKDPFYLYKSLWNTDETTVYITGRRLRYYPVGQDLIIKVYSNAKSLTLYQNDKQVARKTSSGESTGVIWEFPAVRLKTDQDTFKVVSDKGVTDSVTLSRLR
jgi:beta-galactosidase